MAALSIGSLIFMHFYPWQISDQGLFMIVIIVAHTTHLG